jgi:mRNA-degrading endonuclease RelE of RelBE toxin-antitoxin system
VTRAELVVSDEARADLKALQAEDSELVREALRQMLALEEQPYSGEKLRHKSNRKPLAEADCRKVKFDGHRILYRLEPHEGSPDRVYVIAVCEKRGAYGEGAARAAKRLRELAGERARRRQERR